MADLIRIDRDAIPFETSRPDPAKVISGDPVHTTWNLEDRDGLYCGLWQSTPGAWRVSYTEWEYVHILEGVSILHEDGRPPITLRTGDSYVIRPDSTASGRWSDTTLKDYVIRA